MTEGRRFIRPAAFDAGRMTFVPPSFLSVWRGIHAVITARPVRLAQRANGRFCPAIDDVLNDIPTISASVGAVYFSGFFRVVVGFGIVARISSSRASAAA